MPQHIPLTRGLSALVSDADYAWLSRWKWMVVGAGYAGRFEGPKASRRLVYMHRAILNAQSGEQVDHLNGDRLDNRRDNLRLVSNTQNQQNKKKPSHNVSGYKGVCWHKGIGKWHARITVNGQRIHLGYFREVQTAARLYDAAARFFFGEYARPNWPDQPTPPETAGLLAHILTLRATSHRLPAPAADCERRRNPHA